MFWVRSQLFWKIVGLYVLLSLLALLGLILTLNVQLGRQAETAFRDEARRLTELVCQEIVLTDDAEPVFRRWRDSLQALGFRLWLVDADSRPVFETTEAVPDRAIIQSAVRMASRSQEVVRWMQEEAGQDRVLIVARSSPSAASPSSRPIVLLLGDLSEQRQDFEYSARSVTRGAVLTWFVGVVCVVFIAMGLVGPLQVLTENLGSEGDRVNRQDMLLRISDRRDELGQVAQSLTELEVERDDQVRALQQADRQSRSAVELLSAVLDSMVEGVIAIDDEERILFLNAAARRLLGISDVIGASHRLYEAVRLPAFLETVAEALRRQKMQSLEFRTPRDGLTLALVVNPIRKAAHSGAVAVVRDVSDVRRLESMRRDFVSGVSHELKTPLTVIQACTETLLDGAIDDPDASRRFLQQIEEQSERLLQLILGMLQLARVESGTEVFQIESVAVHDVAEQILASLRTVAENRGVTLQREGLAELTVMADEQAVRTIISNLLDNAIKHTPAGGQVTLQLLQESTGSVISIRDTGIGIAREHLPRIFERFYRVDRDRSRERGGTGLGLAIVKHLCQTMKATVSVQSEPGRGAEFRVTFASHRAASAEPLHLATRR